MGISSSMTLSAFYKSWKPLVENTSSGNYVNHLTSVCIYNQSFHLLQFIYSWHI